MSNAKIVFTPILTSASIVYARAFFLTAPEASPLAPGETRNFPIKYVRGNPAATAFRLDWYANRANADARQNRLTDPARLPTAQFMPVTPNTDAEPDVLQDSTVLLTAPAANGYANPVGVIEMVQDTGTIPPYIYLLSDEITIPTEYTEHRLKYAVGNPPATAFRLEWYATRLDAYLMVRQLTKTDGLPRAVFMPETPNRGEAETFQDGVLGLHPPVSDTPYTSAVGLLCIVQNPVKKGDPKSMSVVPIRPSRRPHIPTWETR